MFYTKVFVVTVKLLCLSDLKAAVISTLTARRVTPDVTSTGRKCFRLDSMNVSVLNCKIMEI